MENRTAAEWKEIVISEWTRENKYAATASEALTATTTKIAEYTQLGSVPLQREALEVITHTLCELYAERIKRDEERENMNK